MTCSIDSQNWPVADPRFEQAGNYAIDELELQKASGVLAMLQSKPDYYKFVPNVNNKKKNIYNFWYRPVNEWTCSREKQVQALSTMKEGIPEDSGVGELESAFTAAIVYLCWVLFLSTTVAMCVVKFR